MAREHKNPLIAKITADAFKFYEKYYQVLQTDKEWAAAINEMREIGEVAYKKNPFCKEILFTFVNQLNRERESKEE